MPFYIVTDPSMHNIRHFLCQNTKKLYISQSLHRAILEYWFIVFSMFI